MFRGRAKTRFARTFVRLFPETSTPLRLRRKGRFSGEQKGYCEKGGFYKKLNDLQGSVQPGGRTAHPAAPPAGRHLLFSFSLIGNVIEPGDDFKGYNPDEDDNEYGDDGEDRFQRSHGSLPVSSPFNPKSKPTQKD
jgi:hypothetical protein